MKTIKRVLRPDRLRQVPAQFSWVDHALVQQRLIDRCDAPSAALYLFLVTVADAQGLSYYGSATLAQRLKLTESALAAARAQLIALELIAYEAPLYQVLAVPGSVAATPSPISSPTPPTTARAADPVSLAQLLGQLERRRAGL